MLSFILRNYLDRMNGPYVKCAFKILRNRKTIFQDICMILCSDKQCMSLLILINTWHIVKFIIFLTIPIGTVSHCGFNLHFLLTNEVERLFMCLLAIHKLSLIKCLYRSFAFSWIFLSLRIVFHPRCNSFIRYNFKIFSPSLLILNSVF
jgi:hypothetical protein